MYCSNCGTPITAGLSFCNRCGSDLREKTETRNTGTITAFLTAITLIGIGGLGVMFAGSVVLRKGAQFPFDLIGFFMLFSFLIIAITEIMLVRNLSRLTGSTARKSHLPAAQPPPLELRPPSSANFAEPIGSVTDNTTRTLEYARRDR